MKIRPATPADVEPVLIMIKDFYDESIKGSCRGDMVLDQDYVRKVMSDPEQQKNALILTTNEDEVVGVLGGFIGNFDMNQEDIYFDRIFYIKPNYRRYAIRMIEKLESCCKATRIKWIIMGQIINKDGEGLKRIYEKMGYKSFEVSHIKKVE